VIVTLILALEMDTYFHIQKNMIDVEKEKLLSCNVHADWKLI
jgi:hypothetical protein